MNAELVYNTHMRVNVLCGNSDGDQRVIVLTQLYYSSTRYGDDDANHHEC